MRPSERYMVPGTRCTTSADASNTRIVPILDAAYDTVTVSPVPSTHKKINTISNKLHIPTKRTVLRRKELKLQPPALMLLSDLGQDFILDCIQYINPSPIIICRRREVMRKCVLNKLRLCCIKKPKKDQKRKMDREGKKEGAKVLCQTSASVMVIYGESEPRRESGGKGAIE